MKQTFLPLMGRINAPDIAPAEYVAMCRTYREAVRMCWTLRRVHNLTQRMLACEADLRPQLISDYLNSDDGPQRRDLPADRIALFESVVGNSLISQWIASRARLTVLEEMQAAARRTA